MPKVFKEVKAGTIMSRKLDDKTMPRVFKKVKADTMMPRVVKEVKTETTG